MGGREQMTDVLLEKEVFVTSNRSKLLETEMRLDAPYFSGDYMRAVSIIHESDHPTKPLIDLCEDVFRLTRFKRIWSDAKHGSPYAAPKDLVYFKPFRNLEYPDKSYLAKDKHGDVASVKSALRSKSPMRQRVGEKKFFVEAGWMLITCSGSIGRIMLVTESLTKYFFSHDLIRIVPKKDTHIGYLYAYLNSWVGQAFLKRDKYGGWVKHIEPHQIMSIPVLLPPERTQQEIHDLILKAFGHRESFLEKEGSAIDKVNSMLN